MLPAQSPICSLPAWLQRAVALVAVGIILILLSAAVSPELHAAVHGQHDESGASEEHHDQTSEHTCAVTLLNQGVESGFGMIFPVVAPLAQRTDVLRWADQVARAARTAQLPPGRGPPAC